MNCKKCDQTVFDLSIRSLKDIPNGLKCDQREPSPMIPWQDAHAQLRRYVQDEKVRLLVGPTQLHLVAVQFRGDTIERMEEVPFL